MSTSGLRVQSQGNVNAGSPPQGEAWLHAWTKTFAIQNTGLTSCGVLFSSLGQDTQIPANSIWLHTEESSLDCR